MSKSSSGGNWVTINGVHVLIGGSGTIIKGPASLVGKTYKDGEIQNVTKTGYKKRTKSDNEEKYGKDYSTLTHSEKARVRNLVNNRGYSVDEAVRIAKNKERIPRRTESELTKTYGEEYLSLNSEQRARLVHLTQQDNMTLERAYDLVRLGANINNIKASESSAKYGDGISSLSSKDRANARALFNKGVQDAVERTQSKIESGTKTVKRTDKSIPFVPKDENERNRYYANLKKGMTPQEAEVKAKAGGYDNLSFRFPSSMSKAEKERARYYMKKGSSFEEAVAKVNDTSARKSPYAEQLKGLTQSQKTAFYKLVNNDGLNPLEARKTIDMKGAK